MGSGGASGAHGQSLTIKGWGAGHARGAQRAHVEHATHVRDAGRVEAQRLVELFRVLPSRKEGRKEGSGACKRHARKGLTMDAGARHVRGAR